MPVTDWQFWLVTVFAMAALYAVARPFLPRRRGRRTDLTIGGHRRK